ncbi:nitroreductase family protein [Amaricoccus solimangrovi]|uniref:Putative NAD(P)H nitroreductase n=1 Tax=Amaricoccus solimangrovi TaxID=2589815 RepID=A0A501WT03_9RHOB|nr:nitroreductase [Amaricoccus solimangrovi]TPE51490.1 nitroreductase [Amaricoccus solimangrovi]
MPANPEAAEFLLTRRSRPARLLGLPEPDRETLERLMTAAVRVPDHGKLEPWRLIVLRGVALGRFARAIRDRAEAAGQDPEKGALAFEQAPVAIAVVASPVESEKVPSVEQALSAGAVALSLLNACLAEGWGANWLTGWPAYDAELREKELGLADHEWIAGFIHIGTGVGEVPDRPRPDLEKVVTWKE